MFVDVPVCVYVFVFMCVCLRSCACIDAFLFVVFERHRVDALYERVECAKEKDASEKKEKKKKRETGTRIQVERQRMRACFKIKAVKARSHFFSLSAQMVSHIKYGSVRPEVNESRSKFE